MLWEGLPHFNIFLCPPGFVPSERGVQHTSSVDTPMSSSAVRKNVFDGLPTISALTSQAYCE